MVICLEYAGYALQDDMLRSRGLFTKDVHRRGGRWMCADKGKGQKSQKICGHPLIMSPKVTYFRFSLTRKKMRRVFF